MDLFGRFNEAYRLDSYSMSSHTSFISRGAPKTRTCAKNKRLARKRRQIALNKQRANSKK
jgi:hypothetical protein